MAFKEIPVRTLPLFASSLLFVAFSLSAHATTFPIKNGKMAINLNGDTGGNAGSVTLVLSYTDATKTAVHIVGDGRYAGKNFSVDQSAPLATLKELDVYAAGGDGYNGQSGSSGYDGSSGQDGQNGWNGNDGCPPSDGQAGGNGGYGSNGGNGGDGGDAGNGGSGGAVKITTGADTSELTLLVRYNVSAGSGGSGGSGGSAGRGGRGGSGGRGGRGGSNTCRDGKGNFTGGPSGNSGWNGQDGSNGSDGYSGSNGRGGYDGRGGSIALVTLDAAGNPSTFTHAFNLSVKSVTSIDDNEDGIVEPGEGVSITQIVVTNSGPMPTPTGQILNLTFAANSTMQIKAAEAIAINEVIPGNGSKVLTFPKGTLTFTAPDDAKLIGKEMLLSNAIAINSFSFPDAEKIGLSIHWPVSLSAASNSASLYFGSPKALAYTIKNVTSKDVGPSGEQPVDVSFTWNSKVIPGADVTVVLKDGRTFTLDRPYDVNDFTIPAKGTFAMPITVTVKNTKGALTAAGSLGVTLKLKDYLSDGQDAVDSEAVALGLVADFRPIAISRKIDLTADNITCKFPHRLLQTLNITELDLIKRAGSDQVSMIVTRKGFLSNGVSPTLTVNTFDFGPFGSLIKASSPTTIVAFLNRIFAPASAKDEATWIMGAGTCLINAQ
jgi:hypothetical protein